MTGCFICGGKHFARECPKNAHNKAKGQDEWTTETQRVQVLCTLGEWTSVGSGTCERFKQSGTLCNHVAATPLEVQNRFDILREEAEEETINDPTNNRHYWRFRLHVRLEDMLANSEWLADIREMVNESGRVDGKMTT